MNMHIISPLLLTWFHNSIRLYTTYRLPWLSLITSLILCTSKG
uniref:Uncharacterized protein n=1 Tax=Arundo donax TaxID=35708 RepID=A0A0A9H589_ARUDO